MEGDIDLSSDVSPDKSQNGIVDADINVMEKTSATSKEGKNTSEVSLLAEGFKGMTIKIKPIVSIANASTKKCCNHPLCDTENKDVIVCGECSTSVHFKCSKLPAYQIHRFLTAKNYRKYVCESCCGELPNEFAIKCSDMDVTSKKETYTEGSQLKKILGNSKEVIKSTESVCET